MKNLVNLHYKDYKKNDMKALYAYFNFYTHLLD